MAFALYKAGSFDIMYLVSKIAARSGQAEWAQSQNFARVNAAAADMAIKAAAPQTSAPQNITGVSNVDSAVSAQPVKPVEENTKTQETNLAASDHARPRMAGKIDRSHLPQNVEKFTFADLVDTLNPLQHLPGINDLYRSVSGDEISGIAKVMGGFLFGGIGGGLATFAAETHRDSHNGQSPAETIVATILGDEKIPATNNTMLAQNSLPATQPTTTTPTAIQVAQVTPQSTQAAPASFTSSATAPVQLQAARQQPADYLPPVSQGYDRFKAKAAPVTNKLDVSTMSQLIENKARENADLDVSMIENMAHLTADARVGINTAADTQKRIPELMNAALDKYRKNASPTATTMPPMIPALQRFGG
jgi:hypothetical protein